MAPTNIQMLTVAIKRSQLLAVDRKIALLAQLQTMPMAAQVKLLQLLNQEEAVVATLAKQTITNAIATGNTEFLKQLDDFFAHSDRVLRKTGEGIERDEETVQLEHLLDDSHA